MTRPTDGATMRAQPLLPLGAGLILFCVCASIRQADATPPSKRANAAGDETAGNQAGGKSKNRIESHPLSGDNQAKAYAHMLGTAFKSLGTDHFVVLYDADDKLAKDLVQRIERTFESVQRFASQMNLQMLYPTEKLVVVFFRWREEFVDQYKRLSGGDAPPERADGYYLRRPNVSLFYDVSKNHVMQDFAEKARVAREAAKTSTDAKEKKEKLRIADWYDHRMLLYQRDENRSLIQHEVAHQLLYNLGVHNFGRWYHNPPWLVEGMATLFEPPPGANGAGFNIVNQRRLGDVRRTLNRVGVNEIKGLLGTGSLNNSMLSDDDYGRSWAICYYLAKHKSRQLPKYMEAIRRCDHDQEAPAETRIAEFEAAFGPVDNAFIQEWKGFIDHLPYRPRW